MEIIFLQTSKRRSYIGFKTKEDTSLHNCYRRTVIAEVKKASIANNEYRKKYRAKQHFDKTFKMLRRNWVSLVNK